MNIITGLFSYCVFFSYKFLVLEFKKIKRYIFMILKIFAKLLFRIVEQIFAVTHYVLPYPHKQWVFYIFLLSY